MFGKTVSIQSSPAARAMMPMQSGMSNDKAANKMKGMLSSKMMKKKKKKMMMKRKMGY